MGKAYQKQASVGDTCIELLEMSPAEMQLIKVIRNSLRFGDVTVKIRDGQPYRIVRIQEFVDLEQTKS